jgi:hypothetical protein
MRVGCGGLAAVPASDSRQLPALKMRLPRECSQLSYVNQRVAFEGNVPRAPPFAFLSGKVATVLVTPYEPMPSSKDPAAPGQHSWSRTYATPLALVQSRSLWALSASTTSGADLRPITCMYRAG